ncbi:hypothetical protein B0H34DRAFT_272583 [Crassisporium funariophilum]|nr:hypothetical protein B0H34DRAFT_272583 [Crassisporium funariophilum]
MIETVSTTIYAIGTGADGMTTYVEEDRISFQAMVIPDPTTTGSVTVTLISEPTTQAFTWAEDKSGYIMNIPLTKIQGPENAFLPGKNENCRFAADGTGSCVNIVVALDVDQATFTETETYTGRVVPNTVINVAESTAPPAPGGNAGGGNVPATSTPSTSAPSTTPTATSTNAASSMRIERGALFMATSSLATVVVTCFGILGYWIL